MTEHTFDVDFENYIIFHRGVTHAGVDATDNHLKITYQDGSVQDLGDPYGKKARDNALISEGFAVGKQDGIVVADGSPYKSNNSKYYSEQAQSFMDTANSHMNNAASSASAASTSADAAAASASAAQDSANSAAASATASANSAQRADNIATNLLETKMPGLSYDSVTDTYYIGEIPNSFINNLFYFFL